MAVASFRVWNQRRPAIVLGCSQRSLRASGALRLPSGVALMERASGGGAVLCGPWMVSVSVVLPLGHAWLEGGSLAAYQRLGELHAVVLGHLGIKTRLVPPGDVAAANQRLDGVVPWACFGSLAPWELTDLAGRKLVGLAQRQQRNGVLLVAGTLCHAPDWRLLCEAMGCPNDVPTLRAITAACNTPSRSPLKAGTLALHLGRALAAYLLAPDARPRLACRDESGLEREDAACAGKQGSETFPEKVCSIRSVMRHSRQP